MTISVGNKKTLPAPYKIPENLCFSTYIIFWEVPKLVGGLIKSMKKTKYRHWFLFGMITINLLIFSRVCWSQPLFQEVSDQMGLTWTEGEPYDVLTAAWTDFNSDGFPDLWVTPHAFRKRGWPQLFINQSATTFTDVFSSTWANPEGGDHHCSTWGDFDNDGDPDVFINHGGAGGAVELKKRHLLVNENGKLVDRAPELGLSPLPGSGRNALWFDWNKDGRLDLAHFTETLRENVLQPSMLFSQTETGVFVNVSETSGFIFNPDVVDKQDSARFAVISDLFGDNIPDLLVFDGDNDKPSFLVRVYNNETSALKDISEQFPSLKGKDAVVADFNQDTIPDIFIVGGRSYYGSDIVHEEDKGHIYFNGNSKDGTAGMSFKNLEPVTFDCRSAPSSIFIGANGTSPTSRFFTLSPTDISVEGVAPQSQSGTYIGYDSATETWRVFFSGRGSIDIIANNDFSEVTPINFTLFDPEKNGAIPVYLEYDPTQKRYINRSTEAGFTRKLVGFAVVAGDFDNDMDQDLYIRQAASGSRSLQSVYYENQGNGTFVEIPDAKGATVPILGPAKSVKDFNIGPAIAVADYDRNGFLDIFAAAEVHKTGSENFYVGIPTQLFQNQGNENHWVQIDLEGTVSNRDAIGAKVLVYTPDGKVQMRMQDGGNHNGGQNQHRLHFGLGANTTIDRIEIIWPNGNTSNHSDIAVDQIFHILEEIVPSGIDTDGDGLDNNLDTDDDGDGLPDVYENQYAFLNPLEPSDASADEDGDGKTNLEEYQQGTNPEVDESTPPPVDTDGDGLDNDVDTDDDGDGLPDDYENQYAFLNPLDPSDASADEDSDGKTNLEEYQQGTNPEVNESTSPPVDTDGDGLDNNVDTDDDGDGLPDDYENQYAFLNPLDPSDASADEDSDGKTNLEEYQQGTNPEVNETSTGVSTLTVTKTGDGRGSITARLKGESTTIACRSNCNEGSYDYQSNREILIITSPENGFEFSGWTGDCSGTETRMTVTMASDMTCTARFEPTLSVNKLNVQIAGSGKVTGSYLDCGEQCQAYYLSGKIVSLTAIPDEGYSFAKWNEACGGTSPTNLKARVTITTDMTCIAEFVPSVELTLIAVGDGTIRNTPSGTECGTHCYGYAPDENVRLTATPNEGSLLVGWNGDCDGTRRSNTVTLDVAKQCIAIFLAEGASNCKKAVQQGISDFYGTALVDGNIVETYPYVQLEEAFMFTLPLISMVDSQINMLGSEIEWPNHLVDIDFLGATARLYTESIAVMPDYSIEIQFKEDAISPIRIYYGIPPENHEGFTSVSREQFVLWY